MHNEVVSIRCTDLIWHHLDGARNVNVEGNEDESINQGPKQKNQYIRMKAKQDLTIHK